MYVICSMFQIWTHTHTQTYCRYTQYTCWVTVFLLMWSVCSSQAVTVRVSVIISTSVSMETISVTLICCISVGTCWTGIHTEKNQMEVNKAEKWQKYFQEKKVEVVFQISNVKFFFCQNVKWTKVEVTIIGVCQVTWDLITFFFYWFWDTVPSVVIDVLM